MQVFQVGSVPLIKFLRGATVEIYSLSTSSWKQVEFGELLDGVEIKSDGFNTNGAIFWFGLSVNENKLALLSHTTIGISE
ncbi:hypothetical protein K1719_016618 [Acacia pycnantha]|nr:hypothetical protein K1719_016618 [Acacia pycnantha]